MKNVKEYIKTGFNNLDETLEGGFKKGDLVLLASRPGVGKSSLALNIFCSATLKKYKCAFFRFDSNKDLLAQQALCVTSGVKLDKAQNGELNSSDWEKLNDVKKLFEDKYCFIENEINVNFEHIANECKRVKNEFGLDFAVIDYLQLINIEEKNYSNLTRMLKLLAKELDITILCLSQLPRTIEERKNHRPKLQDLSAYDAIEEDCDVIMFLYNPDNYNENIEDRKGIIELDIARTRHGEKKTLYFKFDRSILKFFSID